MVKVLKLVLVFIIASAVVACDNSISLEELQGLIELGRTDSLLAQKDPRITDVLRYADYAIQDLIISDDESD